MKFKDLNFKIAVIGALHDLGYYNEEAENIKDENDWDEDYTPIPAVVDFYKNLEIDPNYLAKIETFQPDAGDLCYEYLFNVWDGEYNQFDITSLDGIENLKNLKLFDPISMIAENGVDYTPLLLCENLKKATMDFVNEESRSVLKKLEEKGVELVTLFK